MPLAGFEPAVPVSEWSQTQTLYCMAIGWLALFCVIQRLLNTASVVDFSSSYESRQWWDLAFGTVVIRYGQPGGWGPGIYSTGWVKILCTSVQERCRTVLEVVECQTYNILGGVCGLCHMPVGVTSSTYCSSEYSTYTVTSTPTCVFPATGALVFFLTLYNDNSLSSTLSSLKTVQRLNVFVWYL